MVHIWRTYGIKSYVYISKITLVEAMVYIPWQWHVYKSKIEFTGSH